jgi:CDP-glycerol glycerophosphotransferase (TagB/SpsB family)
LRFNGLAHVYLSHGESDKAVMVSNQIKAYDYVFVAGQGAIDRIAEHVILYDVEKHLVPVGRPQLAELAATHDDSLLEQRRHARPTVLYAPTWEGSQPSTTYTSVLSHGPAVVEALLASPRFRLVYRPHPRTGATDASYAEVDSHLRELIARASTRDAAAGHRVDTSDSPYAAMGDADIVITDISAIAMDWLPTGRPMVVTEPTAATAVTVSSRLLEAVPRLTAERAGEVETVVADELEHDSSRAKRAQLVDYYFGGVSAGEAIERFVSACTEVIARRDEAIAALASTVAGRDR